MSGGVCPGCGADHHGQICCDACWDRVPTRAWGRMEDIIMARSVVAVRTPCSIDP